ncbi:AAA family ATPase [Acidovorax sp. SD340]|uniref:AAA family ATPase n=1 Tax=Acidovorax facilis TaxID=12917 RepID=A0ABV8DFN6_9BURK|nr:MULTISPECIES: AAA family ATPase [Acidovorax]MBO1008863.1 AAA family ATPase [Acidovorax sp. SD340]MCO4242682.1 AAA family ATPase [Acidovorax facilis]
MSAATAPAPASILVVLGGLPCVGKSTVANALLAHWPAVYLRIDTIEQALRDSGVLMAGEVGAAGYRVAYALARTQLAQGLPVLADCVNPLPVTREAWRTVARDTRVPLLEVEVICSNAAEHQRRVETRAMEVPGLLVPTWQAVLQHDYAHWGQERLVVDTARSSAAEAARHILSALRERTAITTQGI